MAAGMLSLWALTIGAVVILVRQPGPGDQRVVLAALRDRGPRQHTTV